MSYGARTVPETRDGCSADRHGTPAAYDWWGCRCAEAREAWRIYRKRLRYNRQPPANVPALGTARRLQALVALGHSWTDLAPLLGVSVSRTRQVAMNATGVVHRGNAAKVAEVYERLSGTRGTTGYAFTVAARHGWVPPLAWDDIDGPDEVPNLGMPDGSIVDEIAVARALAGQDVRLSYAEQAAFVRRSVERGESLSAAASRIGISKQTAGELLTQGTSKSRAKRDRVDAEVARWGAVLTTAALARRLGVHDKTVVRSRQRLAERQQQLVS